MALQKSPYGSTEIVLKGVHLFLADMQNSV
jgi:hypothetical protein